MHRHGVTTKLFSGRNLQRAAVMLVAVLAVGVAGLAVRLVLATRADAQASETATPDYVAELPGRCAPASDGACSFDSGAVALVMDGGSVDIDEQGNAHVTGSISIPTNGSPVELANSDLEVIVDENGDIVDVTGTSDAPVPSQGALQYAVVDSGTRAEVGYAWGRDLLHLGAHVHPDRQYFYFTFESSFSMETGFDVLFGDVAGLPVSLAAPGDASVTMVLDPLDPFFYIGGACPDFGDGNTDNDDNNTDNQGNNTDNGKNDDNDSDKNEKATLEIEAHDGEDCGLGVSLSGHIPFEAQVASGAGADLQTFFGHIVIDHSEIPLATGIELDGQLVVRTASDALGFGGNGQVRATLPLVDDVLDLSFPLGDASTGSRIGLTAGDEIVDLFLSGTMDSNDAFDELPGWLPLESPSDATVAASARLVLNLNGESLFDPASFVEMKGEIAMVPDYLAELGGVDLSELLVTESLVRIDSAGVRMQGATTSSIHPSIDYGGSLVVDAFVSPNDPSASYVRLDGDVLIGGVELDGSASLLLDANGFRATGYVATPISRIEVSGLISTTKVDLSGRARLELPLSSIGGLLDDAPAGLQAAEDEVLRLDTEIDRLRSEINAVRETRADDFEAAKADVDTAKAEVEKIQTDIDTQRRRIRQLEREIADWEDWYDDLPAISLKGKSQATAWAELGAEVGVRTAEIGVLETSILGLEAARAVAQLALDGANLVLAGVEAELDKIPVDADPRIVALLAARDTALVALQVAESAVSVLTVDATLVADVQVALGSSGLSGSVSGQVCGGSGCLEVIGGAVVFGPSPEACFTVAGATGCVAF